MIQQIWKAHFEWDDPLSHEFCEMWFNFRNDLIHIQQLQIPRWLGCTRKSRVELHAFSDASLSAYSAAVYIRVIGPDDKIDVRLVSAKTKVAPIENKLSIPRLELSGAELVAKLINEISQVMNIFKSDLYGWTDSTSFGVA